MNLFSIKKLGFTMIELLVVIAVIGILAVALLSSLNPLEQIKKGRDTRTRADMSQLIGGVERYNASLGYFPWQVSEGQDLVANTADIDFVQINGGAALTGCTVVAGCTIADALDQLTTTSEVKASFIDRVTGPTYSETYLYFNDQTTGGSVVACFTPESQSFQKEAFDRCKTGTSAWATDFVSKVYGGAGNGIVCPDGADTVYTAVGYVTPSNDEMICLP